MKQLLTQRYGLAGTVVAGIGIVLVAVSVLTEYDWLRIFGALAVTVGGVAIGIWFGLGPARRLPLADFARRWRLVIGVVAALALSAPVVAALVALLAGVASDAGSDAAAATIALAIVLGATMLAGVCAGLVLCIGAFRRAAAPRQPRVETETGDA